MRKPWLLVAALLVLVAGLWAMRAVQTPSTQQFAPAGTAAPYTPPPTADRAAAPTAGSALQLPEFLPPQARQTIALILAGGPFPHRQDGAVFGNRERHLPQRPRGWYHEYTVETPGADNRGARRIVTGGTPPREWYYTDDHYDSFRPFRIDEAAP